MKTYKKILLVITLLCATFIAGAETYTITTTNGTIAVQGSNYGAEMYEVWNINTGTDKPIIFNYQLDLEEVVWVDGLYIYNVNEDGSSGSCIFSGWGACSGTVSTTLLTGRARVVFETFEGNLGTYDGFSLNFAVDSSVTISDNLYISGKVGIGTGSPQEKLHVNGAICGNVGSARALKLKTAYGYIDLGPQGTQTADINTDRAKFSFNKPIWITEGLLSSGYNKNLLLQTSGTTRMTINKNSGFVGIGTTNPQYLMDVKGTIRATEVLIESVDNFADFVFKPDYELRTPNEISDFIERNGHLPEIPSEQEVKEKGMNLSEMQVKLLQKIEELTLYIIEQDKRITELESKIKE